MSKTLSLKLRDDIFNETQEVLKKLDVPRNHYINRAVAYYNKVNKRRSLAKALSEESMRLSMENMEVLREFERFEDELP